VPANTTTSDAPEPVVGSLSESQQQVLQAEHVLGVLEAQLANLPPECPEFTRRRAAALVRRAQEAAIAVGVAHLHAVAAAYAHILAAEQLVSAEAGQRRTQELLLMGATQVDALWVKADLVNRFVALGYPHEQPAPAQSSEPRAPVTPIRVLPGRKVETALVDSAESHLQACADNKVSEPSSLARMDVVLQVSKGAISRRHREHPEEFDAAVRPRLAAWYDHVLGAAQRPARPVDSVAEISPK
jgi:hypothetical protein